MASWVGVESLFARAIRFPRAQREANSVNSSESVFDGFITLRKISRAAYALVSPVVATSPDQVTEAKHTVKVDIGQGDSITLISPDSIPGKSREECDREREEIAREERELLIGERQWANELYQQFIDDVHQRFVFATGEECQYEGEIAAYGAGHAGREEPRDLHWQPIFRTSKGVLRMGFWAKNPDEMKEKIKNAPVEIVAMSVKTGRPVSFEVLGESVADKFDVIDRNPTYITNPKYVLHAIRKWELFSKFGEPVRDTTATLIDRFLFRVVNQG